MKIKITVIFLALFAFNLGSARADVEKGKAFFKIKCVRCHKTTDQNGTGPGLKGISQRREEKWLAQWLDSPRKMIKSGDPIALELLEKYKTKMPTVFEFRKQEGLLEDVLDYLKTL